ncbi:MAG: hypothetical protein U9N46_12925, partial [Euryarchaeota archaeon]|nr:hypothetical protein [Euryarchaeota archaeon]
TGTWAAGQHTDTATVTGDFDGQTYSDTDDANYYGASPSIDVEKYVSVDGGTNWDDADNPTGPYMLSGTDPQFKFVVTNTGNVELTGISLTDTDFDLSGCTLTDPLAADASFDCSVTGTWAAGQHTDTATVTGDFDGQTYSDTDDANYYGASPSIDVEKYVSVDGGTNWDDADDPTGPYMLSGTNPQFKFVVTNTGNVELTGISLTDSDFDLSGCTVTDPLAVGASFECFVTSEWAVGHHTDTANVTVDFGGQTYSDEDDANYYGANPAFTVTKLCDSTEPVPQLAIEANFKVEFENTGNVDLEITADDGIGTFTLAVGATKYFIVTVNGPFSGQSTVNNTVNASSTYTDSAGNTETVEGTDDGSCVVGGLVNVKKLTQGAVDPTKDWTFKLYEGPDGCGGEVLASSSTLDDTDGILVFGDYNLDPDVTYTVCEEGIPAGWTLFWQVDTNGDGVADTTVIPYNPNEDDDPPQDIGNRCVDIGAGTPYPIPAGGMVFFQVDNTYPGGEPRTPGYWKNWNRCTGGGQADTADQNGGWQNGYWLIEDVLDPNVGGGISWDDIQTDSLLFNVTTCEQAVSILDQRDLVTGKKMASDAAYTLAMHLLAAQMNFAAGAETCQDAQDAALEAEELLDQHDFTGTGKYLSSEDPGYADALALAETLDQYNNGELCSP